MLRKIVLISTGRAVFIVTVSGLSLSLAELLRFGKRKVNLASSARERYSPEEVTMETARRSNNGDSATHAYHNKSLDTLKIQKI